ncbi:DUF6531 domain-containing protein [Saccharopolyspora hirsuta]|uniref:RHS repeat protein n=1 Tax=Saccharopolyspora hirsuta TaxID=1837 RepID=A0A5M7BWH1_SACHI|nr:DUF6531 domain-containing protein [Saccharopolyspora hirsuta]KAA5830685.1 RHS repeat protein [Saccharopolyspora hirsuta]
MTSALELLLDRSRGPAGLPREVELDAGEGPLAELAAVLSTRNGFFAFNAGVQVFRAGEPGVGPELQAWNRPDSWKGSYGGLADGLFCFGQDLFGVQFAVRDRRCVVTFDPETGRTTEIGPSLEDWARWLLQDPDQRGCRSFATRWQDENGALAPDQRLVPWRFFVLGGGYDDANLTAKDAVACMRIRGPVAEQVAALPDGAKLQITVPQYTTGDAAEHDRAPSEMTLVRNGVDVASGRVVAEHTDVALPGSPPLTIRRTHVSSYRFRGAFGTGWASTLDQRLLVGEEGVRFLAEDATIAEFPVPQAGSSALPGRGPLRRLVRADDGSYTVVDGPITLHFGSEGGELPITSVTDRNGNRIEFLRDGAGAPVAVQHSGGHRIRIDAAEGLVTALHLCGSDEDLLLKTYTYDEGRLAAVSEPDGSRTAFEYDGERMSGIANRDGAWFRYVFDEAGRCVRTAGEGGVRSGTIDYRGRSRRVTDSLGFSTTYDIDADGRVERIVDPLGGETTFEHDQRGHLLATTDPLGRTTRHSYDDAGNRVSTTRPDGLRTRWHYDELGLVIAVVHPDGAVHRWFRDERGNLIREVDATGATTTYARNSRGHVTAITDALGNTRTFELNATGLPTAAVDALGNATLYERDAFGNVTAITEPTGAVHRCEAVPDPELTREERTYDTEMRLVQVRRGSGAVHRYEYDPRGLLVREIDAAGRATDYRYDAAGQLVGQLAGGVELRLVRDVQGNVIERRRGAAIATFDYDAAGRLVTAMDGDTQVTFTYDRAGRLLTDTINGRTVTSAYDALGRRVRRRTPSNAESTWVYDAAGRPVAMRTAGRTLRFVHDAAGREVRRTLGGEVVLVRERDARGREVAQVIGDQRSRRTFGGGSAVGPQRIGGERIECDDRGRRVLHRDSRGSWHFSWDDEDRLVGVTTPDGARWRYRYDPLGRRVAKQRLTPDGRGVVEQVEFSWDGSVLAERAHTDRRPNGPALGDARATAWEYKPDTGEVLTHSERSPIRHDASRWADERFFAVITDPDGSPGELLDIRGVAVGFPPVFPIRRGGHYHDVETGFWCHPGGFHDPVLGIPLGPQPLAVEPQCPHRAVGPADAGDCG